MRRSLSVVLLASASAYTPPSSTTLKPSSEALQPAASGEDWDSLIADVREGYLFDTRHEPGMFARNEMPDWCASKPNPKPLNVSGFNAEGGHGVWPSMYVLGVQKAATTSVVGAMLQCGIIALGLPKRDKWLAACPLQGKPCKEPLHTPIDLATQSGREIFTSLYDPTRCDEIVGKTGGRPPKTFGPKDDGEPGIPNTIMRGACRRQIFLEATPLNVGDSPPVATLANAMPAHVASRARFVLILRDPVARILSWYNHMMVDHNTYGEPCPTSNFDGFFRCIAAKNERGSEFATGTYTQWLQEYEGAHKMSRAQLLVLEFESVVKDPTTSVRMITSHFGLPILSNVKELPEENKMPGPERVTQIKCSTRDFADATYAAANEELYHMLSNAQKSGAAPAIEPPFAQFDSSSIECGQSEETEGSRMRRRQLA